MTKLLNKNRRRTWQAQCEQRRFESTVTCTAALALTVIYCCHFHLRCEYLYFSLLGH